MGLILQISILADKFCGRFYKSPFWLISFGADFTNLHYGRKVYGADFTNLHFGRQVKKLETKFNYGVVTRATTISKVYFNRSNIFTDVRR
jgi:hypothetical protein